MLLVIQNANQDTNGRGSCEVSFGAPICKYYYECGTAPPDRCHCQNTKHAPLALVHAVKLVMCNDVMKIVQQNMAREPAVNLICTGFVSAHLFAEVSQVKELTITENLK